MAKYQVNPDALRIMREGRRLTIEDASELSGIPAAKIREFENNRDQPNWGQIERLARVYKVSRLALGDPNPTQPSPVAVDFRTIEGRPVVHTLAIAAVLDEARGFQEAAAEIIADAPALFKAGKLLQASLEDDPAELARAYRREFGITVQSHFTAPSASMFFSVIRSRIEDLGIFVSVMKVGSIEDDCRGFCLMEAEFPPIIVINTEEIVGGARTFSLLHEFSHILLDAPGVSGSAVLNRVERFCNVFATQFLMPEEVVRAAADRIDASSDPTIDEVRRYANRIKCSQQALALRLEELGYAPNGYYERWRTEMESREQPRESGFVPMSYPERMIRRLGTGFSSLVLDALGAGVISEVDAYRATNVRTEHYGEMVVALGTLRQRVIAASGG